MAYPRTGVRVLTRRGPYSEVVDGPWLDVAGVMGSIRGVNVKSLWNEEDEGDYLEGAKSFVALLYPANVRAAMAVEIRGTLAAVGIAQAARGLGPGQVASVQASLGLVRPGVGVRVASHTGGGSTVPVPLVSATVPRAVHVAEAISSSSSNTTSRGGGTMTTCSSWCRSA